VSTPNNFCWGFVFLYMIPFSIIMLQKQEVLLRNLILYTSPISDDAQVADGIEECCQISEGPVDIHLFGVSLSQAGMVVVIFIVHNKSYFAGVVYHERAHLHNSTLERL